MIEGVGEMGEVGEDEAMAGEEAEDGAEEVKVIGGDKFVRGEVRSERHISGQQVLKHCG
jgi:hypothetical protein